MDLLASYVLAFFGPSQSQMEMKMVIEDRQLVRKKHAKFRRRRWLAI
jgi:hypothetical protein